jgi:hypothetical protein
MPTENDPSKAPIAPKKVISNDAVFAQASIGTTGQDTEFTGERVDLPSGGSLYDAKSPARAGYVLVRPMTTKEEEILVTERFHKQGIAIDMLLSRCIMTKGINTMDLLSGDRLHLLFYLRAISYGPEYSFRARMRDGTEQEIKTDVSKLTINKLPEGFQEPWPFQYDGVTYELRFSRGKDEQDAVIERMNEKKKNPKAPDSSPTSALRRQIVSINGDSNPDTVRKAVDRMIAKTAHAIRAELMDKNPGPKVRIEVENAETGSMEDVNIAITESFFRP